MSSEEEGSGDEVPRHWSVTSCHIHRVEITVSGRATLSTAKLGRREGERGCEQGRAVESDQLRPILSS